jgi:hypothetical protein
VDRALPGLGKRKADENRLAELERKIGRQTLKIDFLRRVLQRVEEARTLQELNQTAPSTRRSTKKPSGRRRCRSSICARRPQSVGRDSSGIATLRTAKIAIWICAPQFRRSPWRCRPTVDAGLPPN